MRPNTGLAASQVYANFGGLASDSKVRMLNDPLTPRRYLWRLDTTKMTGTTEMPASKESPDAAGLLRKLAELRAEGILTEDEFAAKKAEILRRI